MAFVPYSHLIYFTPSHPRLVCRQYKKFSSNLKSNKNCCWSCSLYSLRGSSRTASKCNKWWPLCSLKLKDIALSPLKGSKSITDWICLLKLPAQQRFSYRPDRAISSPDFLKPIAWRKKMLVLGVTYSVSIIANGESLQFLLIWRMRLDGLTSSSFYSRFPLACWKPCYIMLRMVTCRMAIPTITTCMPAMSYKRPITLSRRRASR